MAMAIPRVGVLMGSQSDWATMRQAGEVLTELGIAHESCIISAHRRPDRLAEYAGAARENGLRVLIAGAGGAAALPGMVAALTTLPVFGVPIQTQTLGGLDSLLSMVQMPRGVPVGTLAIGAAGAVNAGLLAAAVLALGDDEVAAALQAWRERRNASLPEEPTDTS